MHRKVLQASNSEKIHQRHIHPAALKPAILGELKPPFHISYGSYILHTVLNCLVERRMFPGKGISEALSGAGAAASAM